MPFHLPDEDVKLDAGGDVLVRGHSEVKPGAVDDAGRYGHVQWLVSEFCSAAVAARARLGPRFASPTAGPAQAVHRNVERHRGAGAGLTI